MDDNETLVEHLNGMTREDIFPKVPHNGFCHFCEGTGGGIRTHLIGCPQPVMDNLAEKTRPYREQIDTLKAERDGYRDENENLLDRLAEENKHCDAAVAEDCPWMKIGKEHKVKRDLYRDALERIDDIYPAAGDDCPNCCGTIARTAITKADSQ